MPTGPSTNENLYVGQGVSGRGVFAKSPIPRGQVLIHFGGPVLRYNQTNAHTLAVQVGHDRYLGASGGLDDFVNHSCEPNCGLVIAGESVELISIRDIAADEEINFDYSTTMDEDDFELECQCGCRACRGRVRDFKHLPAELRRRYIELGIVPEYNRRYAERRQRESTTDKHR